MMFTQNNVKHHCTLYFTKLNEKLSVCQNSRCVFESRSACLDVKGTVSPAERCDFVSVKLEKVHELFQVCRICGKGVVFYSMAQCGLLHHKSLCN